MTKIALFVSSLLFAAKALGAVAVGSKLPAVTIQGEDGGRVDGSPWSSDMIKDKVWALFYVDPDERSSNEELEKALEVENFPRDKYGSIGIINMGASWLPNAAIASSLEDKQKKYPLTIYVKDLNKSLVNKWKMTDDQYDVVVFDKPSRYRLVLELKDGKYALKRV